MLDSDDPTFLAISGMSEEELADRFTVPQLRDLCRAVGADRKGRQADLTGRLTGLVVAPVIRPRG